jgi:ketosteroid isomerase-like protein
LTPRNEGYNSGKVARPGANPLRGRTAIACLLLLSCPIALSAQRQPAKPDQEVLIELERSWNAAFYRKDLAFIETVLADEFQATYDDGSRGDKSKELSLATEFNQRVESAEQDDFVVRVYGDTAVVWFSLHLVGPSQGRSLELAFRYVDVFVLRAGRWQCVSSQSTKVTAK